MSVVVLTKKPLTSLTSGYDLRVWYLCRALVERGLRPAVVTVPFSPRVVAEHADEADRSGELFESVRTVDVADTLRPSPLRHLRWSEIHHMRLAYPRVLDAAVDAVNELADRKQARRLIAFGSNLTGIAMRLRHRYRILFDVCDSNVLTTERSLQAPNAPPPDLRTRIALARWRHAEGRLARHLALVTTISEADSRRVRELAKGAGNVVTVPNGMSPELETWQPQEQRRRNAVAFWGNLSFPPNDGALRFFCDRVLPLIELDDFELCVAGGNAEPWLRERAAGDARIRLAGFVPDLYSLASEYPLMVNPMVSGSGLKNKVLEAFALGCTVVSTSLGIEAIEGAVPEVHFALADEPVAFARAVRRLLLTPHERLTMASAARQLALERYTWQAIGRQWIDLVEAL